VSIPGTMSEVHTIPAPERTEAGTHPGSRWRSFASRARNLRRSAAACRARRVLLLLLCLWVLNIFDLALTILASRIGHFEELNPLARRLLYSPLALAAYKLALLTFTSAVFFVFQRHWLTEVGCWCLATVYTALAGLWLHYYYACLP